MYTILGAGLSGIAVADHLKKNNIEFEIFESKNHGGGHIHSKEVDGFTWDEGPHVSFTKYDYVKEYFAENCDEQLLEYPTKPTNYFEGNWIIHPAQSNMYAIPEPLRTECVNDAIAVREALPEDYQPENYQQWIEFAFGKTFASKFSKVYTQKYWTTGPENLTTDWIGKRIYFPELSDMVDSAKQPLKKQTHYITKVRYPKRGGYYKFIEKVEKSLSINYNKKLNFISFEEKSLTFEDGTITHYDNLVNTLPLPLLIKNSDAPDNIKQCAAKLNCSQVLIINVVANHPPMVDNHWIYVYDEQFYSTRINFTDMLSPHNGIEGKCGIQVEVYFSDYHPNTKPINEIEQAVIKELVVMGLLKSEEDAYSYHSLMLDWANVIFDNQRVEAQKEVLSWLEKKGLIRETDDLEPMTNWEEKPTQKMGRLILAGRFAQWKYYWTDDCVMRGKFIGDCLSKIKIETGHSL